MGGPQLLIRYLDEPSDTGQEVEEALRSNPDQTVTGVTAALSAALQRHPDLIRPALVTSLCNQPSNIHSCVIQRLRIYQVFSLVATDEKCCLPVQLKQRNRVISIIRACRLGQSRSVEATFYSHGKQTYRTGSGIGLLYLACRKCASIMCWLDQFAQDGIEQIAKDFGSLTLVGREGRFGEEIGKMIEESLQSDVVNGETFFQRKRDGSQSSNKRSQSPSDSHSKRQRTKNPHHPIESQLPASSTPTIPFIVKEVPTYEITGNMLQASPSLPPYNTQFTLHSRVSNDRPHHTDFAASVPSDYRTAMIDVSSLGDTSGQPTYHQNMANSSSVPESSWARGVSSAPQQNHNWEAADSTHVTIGRHPQAPWALQFEDLGDYESGELYSKVISWNTIKNSSDHV